MPRTLFFVAAVVVELVGIGPASATPSCAAHLPYGEPLDLSGSGGDTVTVCHRSAERSVTFFIVHYDRDRIAPRWVAYHLSRSKMFAVAGADITRSRHAHEFIPDSLLDFGIPFRAPTHHDFASSGFDRGHLAPAEAMKWDLEAYRRTFTVGNIALQASRFNQQLWSDLETQMQGWACDFGTLFVVTGVIFAGDESRMHRLRRGDGEGTHIPTHFYKALYTPAHDGQAIAFVFDNDDASGPLAAGAVSIRELEEVTALDFFPDMPIDRQELIESAGPNLTLWRTDYPSNFRCNADHLRPNQ